MRTFWLAVASVAILASGCTTTKVLRPKAPHQFDGAQSTILLMPLDVELLELAAGGTTAPRADWTAAAQEHLQKAIVARIERSRASHVGADANLLAPESPHLQLFELHEVMDPMSLRDVIMPMIAAPVARLHSEAATPAMPSRIR